IRVGSVKLASIASGGASVRQRCMSSTGGSPDGQAHRVPVLAKAGWRARKLEVDGERVRKTFDLKTDNKAAARIKLRRLLEQNAPTETEAVRVETFREATERIVGERAIRTNRGAK